MMESLADETAVVDGSSRNPVKKRVISAALNISVTAKVFKGFSCIMDVRGNSRKLLDSFLSNYSNYSLSFTYRGSLC